MPAQRWATVPNAAARLAPAVRRMVSSGPTRRAVLRRVVAATVVALVALNVARVQERAEEIREHWDPTVEVIVAFRDLPTGSTISRSDVETELRPEALVPDGALDALEGTTPHATAAIAAGEVVLASRVGNLGEGSTDLRPGRSAVEIELGPAMPEVGPGNHIDLLAVPQRQDPYLGTGGSAEGAPRASAVGVARDAIVLEVRSRDDRPSTMTAAVRDDDVATTAAAILAGPVAVVLRPPPD